MVSPLLQLSSKEWEDLCDGCGRCCMVKLEDEDTGALHYTNVACQFLDQSTCRCKDYAHRATIKPECMILDRNRLQDMKIMPSTCAYRVVHEGGTLPADKGALSMAGMVVSEEYIHEDQLPEHIVEWIKV